MHLGKHNKNTSLSAHIAERQSKMRQQLDDLLCERYPVIFQNRYRDMQHTAMCWGFDCGDGWFDLLDSLCKMITHHLTYNADKDTPPVIADQVKEKYGTLRFYAHGGDKTTDAYIEFAEYLSGLTCEVCGKPGKLNKDNTWLKTTCEEHVNW